MSDEPTTADADDLPMSDDEIAKLDAEAASLTPEERAAPASDDDEIVEPGPVPEQMPLRGPMWRGPSARIAAVETLPSATGNQWRTLLKKEFTRAGSITPGSPHNVLVFLTHHPMLAGAIAYDELRECIVKKRAIEWADHESVPARDEAGADEWDDSDDTRLTAWFDRVLNVKVSGQTLRSSIGVVAQRARFHPVRDYLRGLVWDGTVRLDAWLATYLGSAAGAYERAIGVRWMIAAVARIMRPGCQSDHVLIFEGATGKGKSSALRILADPWFSDDDLQLGSAEAAKSLRGVWVQELGEIPRMTRRDGETLKAFVSRRQDHYRDSFGHRAQNFPRRCVFAGTTEDDQYLVDPRGGRRWWGVRIGEIGLDALKRDRDMLWAEAVVRFDGGDPWHVDSAQLAALCTEEQSDRVISDPWEEKLAKWLETDEARRRVTEPGYLTTTDVLSMCLDIPAERRDRSSATRVGQAMKRLGWQKRRFRDGSILIWGYANAARAF